MNIKSLLESVNAIDVVNEMIEQHKEFFSEYSEARLKITKDNYCNVIEKLKNMRPDYKGKKYILLATYTFDILDYNEESNFQENNNYYLTTNLYKTKDLEKIKYIPELYNIDIESVPSENIKELIKSYHKNKLVPTSYSYSMDPWNETLTFTLNELNVEEIGAHKLLADYLWEITFYGIDEEDIEAERNKLHETSLEVDKIKDKIKEAKENNEEVNFEELGLHDINELIGDDYKISDKENNIIDKRSLLSVSSCYRDLVYYFIFRK